MADASAPPAASTAPEPSPPSLTRPPSRRARSAAAWIVLPVIVLGGAGLIALADVQPSDAPQNHAETFLPPDGSATRLDYASGESWVIESRRSIGLNDFLQLPGVAGESHLERLGAGADTVRVWRQIWTDRAGERGQLTELYELADDGIRLMTLTGGPSGFTYDPALLVLPADVAPGSTWSSEGAALPLDLMAYSSTGTARAAADGCLEIELAVTYTDPQAGDAVLLDSVDTSTWCPGAGVVASTFVAGDVEGRATSTELDPRARVDVELSAPAPDLEELAKATPADVTFVTRDPLFPESTITSATDGSIATTASGVAAVLVGTDVVGYRAGAEESEGVVSPVAEKAWVVSPGARVTELSTIGNLVLVATTDRRLVAYSDSGLRGWTADFADVMMHPVVADGSGGGVAVALDGEVRRLSLSTGVTGWSRSLPSTPTGPAAVSNDSVFVVTTDDTLTALDLETGDVRWTAEASGGIQVAVLDDRVIVSSQDTSLLGFDVATGEPMWVSSLLGLPQAVLSADDSVIVVTLDGTSAFDSRGRELWSRPESRGAVAAGSLVALLDTARVTIVDGDGAELGSWQSPPITTGVSRTLAPLPDALWLLGSDFTALEWSTR